MISTILVALLAFNPLKISGTGAGCNYRALPHKWVTLRPVTRWAVVHCGALRYEKVVRLVLAVDRRGGGIQHGYSGGGAGDVPERFGY
jgi:hypothetical protein